METQMIRELTRKEQLSISGGRNFLAWLIGFCSQSHYNGAEYNDFQPSVLAYK